MRGGFRSRDTLHRGEEKGVVGSLYTMTNQAGGRDRETERQRAAGGQGWCGLVPGSMEDDSLVPASKQALAADPA